MHGSINSPPYLVLLQSTLPLLLQMFQLFHGSLQGALLGQALLLKLLFLSFRLRDGALLPQVNLFQLGPLCGLLLQQPETDACVNLCVVADKRFCVVCVVPPGYQQVVLSCNYCERLNGSTSF